MQRISVDLPEPDGPQMTKRCPLATVRSMSLSAWKLPYHLPTPSILTAIVASSLAKATFAFPVPVPIAQNPAGWITSS